MKEILITDNPAINEIISYQLESSGKMLRPRLVFLTASMAAHDPAVVRDAAVAVELIHMASLVHDDVIDHAMLRRGRASINSRWGNHASVLTGDYLFATAFNLINHHGMQEIMENITTTIRIMCAGEIQQMAMAFNVYVTEEDYFAKTYGKTACLFASACKVGALASSMPPKEVYEVEQFGLCMGYAYQIFDDLLDFLSDSTTLGKPTGSDLMEGNITLPVIFALGNNQYGPWLKSVLSKGRITGKQVEKVVKVLLDSKAIDYCLEMSHKYIERGLQHLSTLPGSPAQEELRGMAAYLLNDYYGKLQVSNSMGEKEAVK